MPPISLPWTKAGFSSPEQQKKKPESSWNILMQNGQPLLNNLVREEIKIEIKDLIEFSENEDTAYPNL